MSNPVSYRSALARSLSPEEEGLLESCLARSEQIENLARSLPEIFLANQTRREGREVTFSNAQLRSIKKSERVVRRVNAEIPELVAKIPSVDLLFNSLLESERSAMRIDEAVFTGGHPEDEALAKPLLDLRSANIAEIEGFLSRAEL